MSVQKPRATRRRIVSWICGILSICTIIILVGIIRSGLIQRIGNMYRTIVAQTDAFSIEACIENLKALDLTIELWATHNLATNGVDARVDDLVAENPSIASLNCPKKGEYEFGTVGELPACTVQSHNLFDYYTLRENASHGPYSALFFGKLLEYFQQPDSRKGDSRFFLTDEPPEPVPAWSLDELGALWPVFEHQDFDSSGFMPLILPFQCDSTVAEGRSEPGFAFAFMLSWTLDWVPNNYTRRHSYFIFKRSGAEALRAGRTLDTRDMQPLAKYWGATHTIGGTLRESPAGYGAQIILFDRNLKRLTSRTYEAKYAFIDLVAEVTVALMRDLGHNPSSKLEKLLRQRTFEHKESIKDLGAAAFAVERSGDEFGRYRTILQRDPEFAYVRFWLANQGYWQHGNDPKSQEEKRIAVDSQLMPYALGELNIADLKAQGHIGKFDEHLQHVSDLIGQDNPIYFLSKHRRTNTRYRRTKKRIKPLSAAYLNTCIEMAASYPNDTFLHQSLAHLFLHDRRGPMDAAMAGGLALAGIRCRDKAGAAEYRFCALTLGDTALRLGYHRLAARVLLPVATMARDDLSLDNAYRILLSASDAFSELGWYSLVPYFEPELIPGAQNPSEIIPIAAISAHASVLAGMERKLVSDGSPRRMKSPVSSWEVPGITRRSKTEPTTEKVLEAYNHLVVGQLDKAEKLLAIDKLDFPTDRARAASWVLPAYAQIDIARKKTTHLGVVKKMLSYNPHVRSLWKTYDLYDRTTPSRDADAFYSYLEWLHSDDPWVRSAVKARRQRMPVQKTQTKPAIVMLSKFNPNPWPQPGFHPQRPSESPVFSDHPPCLVFAAVKTLLDDRRYDEATDVTLKAHRAAEDTSQYALMSQFNYLYHIIQGYRLGKPPIIGRSGRHSTETRSHAALSDDAYSSLDFAVQHESGTISYQ